MHSVTVPQPLSVPFAAIVLALVGDRALLPCLRVAVSDANGRLPEPRQAAPDDESGRGLTLVAVLADDWGAVRRDGGIGKTVWFELAHQSDGR